jgi:hypothetical protein
MLTKNLSVPLVGFRVGCELLVQYHNNKRGLIGNTYNQLTLENIDTFKVDNTDWHIEKVKSVVCLYRVNIRACYGDASLPNSTGLVPLFDIPVLILEDCQESDVIDALHKLLEEAPENGIYIGRLD